MDDAKKKMILEWIGRISHSELTITGIFEKYNVPFSKAQYFNYKKQIAIAGPEGLQDRRKLGGNRKLNLEAEGFLRGSIKSNPDVTLKWLQSAIYEDFTCELSLSAISRALKRICGNQMSVTFLRLVLKDLSPC